MSDPGGESSPILYGSRVDFAAVGVREEERIENPNALEFLWRTEPLERRVTAEYMLKDPTGWFKILSDNPDRESFLKGRLRLQSPADLIGPATWHDVIVRFTGPRLELFIDGVLVDEQWPHGAIYGLKGPLLLGAGYENGRLKAGFRGQIEHVAFWNRALGDDEIAALSGGKKQIERRETEILGGDNPDAQYWRPKGANVFVGDCMLFSHAGRLHLFYLFDRRHHRSKWGMGAHQFAHMSTRDLAHWEQHPMALSITDQAECSLGTGCCVFRDGVYYLFYIQHGKRAAVAQRAVPRRQHLRSHKLRLHHIHQIAQACDRDGVHANGRCQPARDSFGGWQALSDDRGRLENLFLRQPAGLD